MKKIILTVVITDLILSLPAIAGLNYTMWEKERIFSTAPPYTSTSYIGFSSGNPFSSPRPLVYTWDEEQSRWNCHFSSSFLFIEDSGFFDTNIGQTGIYWISTCILIIPTYSLIIGFCDNNEGTGKAYNLGFTILGRFFIPEIIFVYEELTKVCDDWYYFQPPDECVNSSTTISKAKFFKWTKGAKVWS